MNINYCISFNCLVPYDRSTDSEGNDPKTKELQTFYRKVNDVRKYPNPNPLHGFTQQKLCAIEHRVMYNDHY